MAVPIVFNPDTSTLNRGDSFFGDVNPGGEAGQPAWHIDTNPMVNLNSLITTDAPSPDQQSYGLTFKPAHDPAWSGVPQFNLRMYVTGIGPDGGNLADNPNNSHTWTVLD